MMRAGILFLVLLLACLGLAPAHAEPHQEPKFPPTCIVLRANATIQLTLQSALAHCPAGMAVELARGARPADNAFTIGPITLPPGVSLIVDGGVTLYGTTDASQYQMPFPPANGPLCGTVGATFPVYGICKPLISFTSRSGIYGYGIIDGQGEKQVTVNHSQTIPSWWSLLAAKKSCSTAAGGPCEQASPLLIAAGDTDGKSEDLTLYKITLRNPPFHTVRLAGKRITVWGVKVQAPWDVPNSDGFDVHGQDILIKDSIVANGDQDVALTSSNGVTSDVTIAGLRAYAKGGVALLDDGPGFSNIRIDDFAMTGDLPSVQSLTGTGITAVNGVTAAEMYRQHGVQPDQALPSATDDTQGLQINTGLNSTSLPKDRRIVNVTFNKICIMDIVSPVHIGPLQIPATPPKDGYPQISGITFRDATVPAPGPQFLTPTRKAVPAYAPGRYRLTLQADPSHTNGITFDDLVFGNARSTAESLFGSVIAEHNLITVFKNAYPPFLNELDGNPPANSGWSFVRNAYALRAGSSPTGSPCSPAAFPFLTGELYAGIGPDPTGYNANLQKTSIRQTTMLTLYAVVQPAMSQTSQFMADSYGATPGLYAIASPALTGQVTFYDNGQSIGTATIPPNGTLATLTIAHIAQGPHAFTAEYADPPERQVYDRLRFGAVAITATP